MLSPEQFEDREVGNALVRAAFSAIDRQHVKSYAELMFSRPGELTEKVRRECMQSLFEFATLGWAAFHFMNNGQPLKDREKKKRKSRPKKKTKQATK